MTGRSAIQASYTDWKLIRTRSVVQLVFEIPIEESNIAFEVLGGMPKPGNEVWCAVARLKSKQEMAKLEMEEKQPRPFTSLPLPQQSALLCADPVFRAFLNEEYGCDCHDDESTAAALRKRCKVTSRADIKSDTTAATLFTHLREQFIAWKLVAQ